MSAMNAQNSMAEVRGQKSEDRGLMAGEQHFGKSVRQCRFYGGVAGFISVVAVALLSLPAARGDFTRELAHRWTFNAPGETLLVDDVAGVRLEPHDRGTDQTITPNADGTVTLGSGQLLTAPAINATDRPELLKGVTIWARLRLDTEPSPNTNNFILGLLNANAPADWKQQTLTVLVKGKTKSLPAGYCQFAQFEGGGEVGNATGSPPIKTGAFANIAIVFDGTQRTVTMYIDSQVVARKAPGSEVLQPFQALGVGRLRMHSGQRVVVDELRFYRVPLPAEWIAEIKPVSAHAQSAATTADQPSAPQKYVLVDFEDVATWRTSGASGTVPDAWFAGGLFLGAAEAQAGGRDRYVGQIRYAFAAGDRPKFLTFKRCRMSQVSAFIEAIEFQANPHGLNCAISFALKDIAGKLFRVRSTSLSGETWQAYRVPIDATTVSNFAQVSPPLRIHDITLATSEPGARAGSVLLDDITIVGVLSSEHRITIAPLPEPLARKPGEPVSVGYRLRNADPRPVRVRVNLRGQGDDGAVIPTLASEVVVPPYGQQVVRFDLGALPVGPYALNVDAESGDTHASLLDWVAVFSPNGGRINREGMLFGVQDLTSWQGEGENRLHMEWMRALGIDINRIFMTGGRLEPSPGVSGAALFVSMLRDHEVAGIDVCMLYNNVPAWTQQSPNHVKKVADDEAAFAKHVRHIGRALAGEPNLKYIEFWNEPDISLHADNSDVQYFSSLRIFYRAMKEVAPRIRIATGAYTGVEHPKHRTDFERIFWEASDAYDIANFHAHGAFEAYAKKQAQMEGFVAKAGGKPIANAEAGERSGYTATGAWAQAETLVKKITFARHRGTEFYIWFTLQDYWDMDTEADDSFGLVTVDNRPKPSFLAYNELIRQLAGTTPIEPLALHEDLTTFRFRTAATGEDVHVCWSSRSGNPVALAVRCDSPLRVTDMYGRSHMINTADRLAVVPVEGSPVYLRCRADGLRPADLSFVRYPKQVATIAGQNVRIPLELNNPWERPVRFSARVETRRSAAMPQPRIQSLKLAPGETGRIVLTHASTVDEAVGSRDLRIAIDADGGATLALQLPVALHISYGVRRVAGPLPVDAAVPIADPVPVIHLDALEDVHEITHDPKIPRWSGPVDLSVRAAAVHDEHGLLFLLDVTDDVHVQEHGGTDIWRGDSVQLAIEGRPGQHIELTAALTPSGPQAWCHLSPAAPEMVGAWRFPVTAQRQGDRTSYRIYVPLTALGLSAGIGDGYIPFRFAFLVNEHDGQGRVRWMHWYDGIGMSKNTAEYGYGLLTR